MRGREYGEGKESRVGRRRGREYLGREEDEDEAAAVEEEEEE